MLRAQKVVGKFVEFYGEGAASLPLPDRATIGNMAPEYGATMGYFPVDGESVNYLRATGRTDEQCAAFENYFRAQKMFGMPQKGEIDYSVDLELDLARSCSRAWPARSVRRTAINLPELGSAFRALLEKPVKDGGYGKSRGRSRQTSSRQSQRHAAETERDGFDRQSRIRGSSRAMNGTRSRWSRTARRRIGRRRSTRSRAKRSSTGKAGSATAAS